MFIDIFLSLNFKINQLILFTVCLCLQGGCAGHDQDHIEATGSFATWILKSIYPGQDDQQR